jgi:hypothetical protein
MSAGFRWTHISLSKLIRMKVVGHRAYRQIASHIGCTTSDAQKAYKKYYLSV